MKSQSVREAVLTFVKSRSVREMIVTVLLWLVVAGGVGMGVWAHVRVSAVEESMPAGSEEVALASVTGVGAIESHLGGAATLRSVSRSEESVWVIAAELGGVVYSVGVEVVGSSAVPVSGVTLFPEPVRPAGSVPLVVETEPVTESMRETPALHAAIQWVEGWLTGVDVARFASEDLDVVAPTRRFRSAAVTEMGGVFANGNDEAMLLRLLVDTTRPKRSLEFSVIVTDRGDGHWVVHDVLPTPITQARERT